jgi:RNA polymerase sigma-70 factor (ECF subfamily)
METSVSLLQRLAGKPTSDDWKRLLDLMQRVRGDFAPATWQAFLRHVLDDVPAPHVAEELGLSLNSVLLAKSRVLKRLRQESAGLLDC